MISQKIIAEFSPIHGNFTSITFNLLPKNSLLPFSSAAHKFLYTLIMADQLHKAIGAMSIEDEAPLVLPDSPQFTVCDENATSLLGRLLNPDFQSMARMIDYMPTAWRVYGRVRGIALSRDRFQFIFQREEDLQTVLKDRPWSYNHWTIVLERWTASPQENFLGSLEIWIRMRNIPVNHFTSSTMYMLAKEIGKVEEIAFDPKVSHFKDYVRAKITFNVDNPVKAYRELSILSGGTVKIEYEYEKIHKRCFHCLRLTHEKIKCPLLKKGFGLAKSGERPNVNAKVGPSSVVPQRQVHVAPLEGPPGFPPLFPELSKEEQKMAMMYISHSNEIERLARIQRVRQGIADNARESSIRLTKITNEVDKGKGHVYYYPDGSEIIPVLKLGFENSNSHSRGITIREEEAESSDNFSATVSVLAHISTGFQFGPSSEGRVSGNLKAGKTQRKRPSSWKRKTTPKLIIAPAPASGVDIPQSPLHSAKRKQSSPVSYPDNKTPKRTDSSVASVLKPLLPQ
ncbi:hypothetical protein Bca4012_072268 [Brassica carinata]